MPLHRILVLHNRYREEGGEDRVFEREVALLRAHGHEVVEYVDSNRRLEDTSRLAAGLNAVWSRAAYRRVKDLVKQTNPDLAHFHNTFCVISPAAYAACRRAGLPVVQTLHNYRMGCLNADCAVAGTTCDACVPGRIAWRGVWRGCYRHSRALSAAAAAISSLHKCLAACSRQVDAYISTSEFARGVHLRAGVPLELSHVKPNFSTAVAPPNNKAGNFGLYVGRLAPEKGVAVLLEAWRRLDPRPRLVVAGDSQDAAHWRAWCADMPEVEFAGPVAPARVRELMSSAQFLVAPSLLWENCPLAVIEAFGCKLPTIVSGHGALAQMVEDGRTGLHFRPGDAGDLADRVRWLVANPGPRLRMASAARETFERNYTPEKNYEQLLAIYEAARRHRGLHHS